MTNAPGTAGPRRGTGRPFTYANERERPWPGTALRSP